MTKVVLLDAGPEGWVHWELKVTEFYANQNGTYGDSRPFMSQPVLCASTDLNSSRLLGVMHGGAAGVIFGEFSYITSAPACWSVSAYRR